MNATGYIVDTPLPINQDFKALKEKGLAYIQENSGTEWTNLNPSDPGITILDQCCYALTELGYCNDFPIADILAGPGDKLETDDRFYLPERILAASPVTTEDYRKYLIDGVDDVRNAVVTPYASTVMNIYRVYLLIDESVKKQDDIDEVCKAAFFHLNKHRNLGELFLKPVALKPGPVTGNFVKPVMIGLAGSVSNIRPGNPERLPLSLPPATFRDINSYYSIQHTFPEIFAVGADAITKDATDFQIAKSRQLKGYLTLFDQVLANQFSQLANVGQLFSFKNTLTGAPSVMQSFYAAKDESEKKHPQYPVPYLSFSPTYFYQSLYDVPHIKPLLKDNDAFKFGTALESEEELEHKSWNAYKQDPYNPYIRGLMECMEDEKTALTRRNDILDHLLARHGESPMLIDSIIDGSRYSGERLKDQVIFKSLYLQNLGMLSCNRMKACNFFSAKKIRGLLTGLNANFIKKLTRRSPNDFIFDSQETDQREKLKEQDFIDYAALELKLCLLFGLKAVYCDYISATFDDYIANTSTNEKINEIIKENDEENIKLALWMILRRRGVIFIERGLLEYCRTADPVSGGEPGLAEIGSGIRNGVELVFPAFIFSFNTEAFKKRLDLFLHHTLPVGLTYKCHFADSDCLKQLIPAFANWRNALRHKKARIQVTEVNAPMLVTELSKYANVLAGILNKINSPDG